MAGLQRFITYIYKYENDEKKENAGFAKIEIRGTICRVEVHIRNINVEQPEATVYLYAREKEIIQGIPVGNIEVSRGNGDVRYAFETKELLNFGKTMRDMEGIFIPLGESLSDTLFLASQWKEGTIEKRRFQIMEKKKPQETAAQIPNGSESPQPAEDAAEQPENKEAETNPRPTNDVPVRNSQQETLRADHLQQGMMRRGSRQQGMQQNVLRRERVQQGILQGENRQQGIPPQSEGMQPELPQTEGAQQEGNLKEAARQEMLQKENFQQVENHQNSRQEAMQTEGSRQEAMQTEGSQQEGTQMENPQQEVMQTGNMQQESLQTKNLRQEALPSENPNVSNELHKTETGHTGAANMTNIPLPKRPGPFRGRRNIRATELPAEEFFEDTGWERMFQKLRLKLDICFPFEGQEIECVRMQLNDLQEFPQKYWYLGNNSFLLHGFFNYRHIIFGERKSEETKEYFIGVPGVFQNQERIMATMFGFPEFCTAKNTEYKTGNFGYWYRIM